MKRRLSIAQLPKASVSHQINSSCAAFDEVIVVNQGLGHFNVETESVTLKCPTKMQRMRLIVGSFKSSGNSQELLRKGRQQLGTIAPSPSLGVSHTLHFKLLFSR